MERFGGVNCGTFRCAVVTDERTWVPILFSREREKRKLPLSLRPRRDQRKLRSRKSNERGKFRKVKDTDGTSVGEGCIVRKKGSEVHELIFEVDETFSR